MTVIDDDRRTILKASGTTLAVALAAGCLGDDDEEPSGGDDGNGDDGGDADVPAEVEDWMGDANNYDGGHDYTGEDEVTIDNGQRDGTYLYDPAVIVVDAGTTVTWEWLGDQSHTVTHEGGEFDSDYISGEGETWEHTFDEEGTYLYYCEPHRGLGQKGAVVVE